MRSTYSALNINMLSNIYSIREEIFINQSKNIVRNNLGLLKTKKLCTKLK